MSSVSPDLPFRDAEQGDGRKPCAVPWIAMRSDLVEDPSLVGLSRATGLDAFAVIGRLQRLWAFADRQSADGFLPHITIEWIDDLVRHQGFALAMVQVGWLRIEEAGVTFPNFDRWMGQSAKARLKDTARKRAVRELSGSQPDKKRTRREVKRREEKRTGVSPGPPPTREADGFEQFWSAYPRKEGKANARREWSRLKPDPLIQAGILDALSRQRLSDQWTRDNGRYVPKPDKWLRDRRWEDEPQKEEPGGRQPGHGHGPRQDWRSERVRYRHRELAPGDRAESNGTAEAHP